MVTRTGHFQRKRKWCTKDGREKIIAKTLQPSGRKMFLSQEEIYWCYNFALFRPTTYTQKNPTTTMMMLLIKIEVKVGRLSICGSSLGRYLQPFFCVFVFSLPSFPLLPPLPLLLSIRRVSPIHPTAKPHPRPRARRAHMQFAVWQEEKEVHFHGLDVRRRERATRLGEKLGNCRSLERKRCEKDQSLQMPQRNVSAFDVKYSSFDWVNFRFSPQKRQTLFDETSFLLVPDRNWESLTWDSERRNQLRYYTKAFEKRISKHKSKATTTSTRITRFMILENMQHKLVKRVD